MPGADRRRRRGAPPAKDADRRRDAAPAKDAAPAPDWDAVRDELGATEPGAFVEARERNVAEARAAGDSALAKRIHALHRPTLSAWASNLLVRSTREEVESFLRLGASMRRAQKELDAPQLRDLSRQQWRVISLLSKEAANLAAEAGHPLSETVRREVESTLRAALADPGAAEQWAAGHLDKPLQAPMQLTPSDDTPEDQAPETVRPDRHRKAREREAARTAERKREAARATERERELREARKRQLTARTAHAHAAADLDRARSHVEDLRAQLADAEQSLARATATARTTEEALTEADATLDGLT